MTSKKFIECLSGVKFGLVRCEAMDFQGRNIIWLTFQSLFKLEACSTRVGGGWAKEEGGLAWSGDRGGYCHLCAGGVGIQIMKSLWPMALHPGRAALQPISMRVAGAMALN